MNMLIKASNTQAQADALNRFKQCFNHLSGKEVDVSTFDKIEKFKTFQGDLHKLLIRFKQILEKAMTTKVEYDNAKVKCLEVMADIEELVASEISGGMTNMKMRAQ